MRRSDWKGRLKLFNVYFVRGADYRRAVRLVGVSEATFDYWYKEVKRSLNKEFSRTGLFPPEQYFLARTSRPEKIKRTAGPRKKAHSATRRRVVILSCAKKSRASPLPFFVRAMQNDLRACKPRK